MTTPANTWREELDFQLEHGKQVLLYGNVDDRYLLPGEETQPVLLGEWLDRYLEEEGYELVVHYDLADGLRTSRPEKMDTLLLRLLEEGRRNPAEMSPPTDRLETDSREVVQGGYTLQNQRTSEKIHPRFRPAPSRSENESESETNKDTEQVSRDSQRLRQQSRAAEDVIPQLRQILAQNRISTAVVLDFADKLFDDPKRQNKAEREYLLHLKKVLTEAATIPEGVLAGRRNAFLLVAAKLSSIPLWFYQDHPLLSLLRIPPPLEEERLRFLDAFWALFVGEYLPTEKEREEFRQVFADATSGLTLWDLMMLGVIVNRERGGGLENVRELKKLISFYRYGQKEDPWEKFNEGNRRDKIQEARTIIEERVKGQTAAVESIVDMLVTATVGVSMSRSSDQGGKPKGVFFFVGPTGVGKTELAKAVAQLIFGDENRLRRFDMSEFTESHAAEKLTGSPPGYVGYEEGGQLTNYVREHPFSLLLFDEIEKAHGQVMDKFLQILEDGRLTDSKGQTAYFAQSVIIFTSNIGADSLFPAEMNAAVTDDMPDYETYVKQHFLEKVREHFVRVLKRPEILNRFGDNILVFDLLRPAFVRQIGEKFLRFLTLSALEKRGLTLQFEPSILGCVEEAMRRPENIKNGGRRIRTFLEDRLEKKLNRWIFEHEPARGTTWRLGLDAAGQLQVVEQR